MSYLASTFELTHVFQPLFSLRVFHPNNLDIFLYHPRLSHGRDDERFYGASILSADRPVISAMSSATIVTSAKIRRKRNSKGFSLKMSKNDAITSETEASNAHDS